MKNEWKHRYAPLCLLAVSLSALAGCRPTDEGVADSPVCAVMVVSRDTVALDERYAATIRGRQDIDLYPQVSGTIVRLCVTEGQRVRKGETLFVIDRVPYEAALRTASANVHAAKAQVEMARLDYEAKQSLFQANVVSKFELARAENTLAVTEAALEQAQAQEIDARNSLSYTEVKSPSEGVVGTLPYRTGALVGPSMAQPLTTVSDNGVMYVYFSMTESRLRALVRQYGSPEATLARMPPIALTLNDGMPYGETGRVEAIGGIVDEQTGTVPVRAVFPNGKRLLWSGGVGNVVIPRVETDVLVIPQAVTVELQDKVFVYKVTEGHRVAAVEIAVDGFDDGKRYIVRAGISAGDTIVSEGVGLLRDGMVIRIREEAE